MDDSELQRLFARETGGEASSPPSELERASDREMWGESASPAEYAKRQQAAGIATFRSPEEHRKVLKERGFNDQTIGRLMSQYGLEMQRRRFGVGYQTALEDVPLSETYRRLDMPFGSVFDSARIKETQEARKRFEAGNPTQKDLMLIAEAERFGEMQQQMGQTRSGQAINILGGVGKAAAEFEAGGAIAGRLGLAKAMPEGAGLLRQGAVTLRNAAGTLPFVPSMWLDEARQKNIDNGRDVNDPRGMGQAYLHNIAAMAVLGKLQESLGSLGGVGIKAGAKEIATKGALGVVEQGGIDAVTNLIDKALPQNAKLSTGYGTFDHIVRGEYGEAMKEAATQAITFGVFAGIGRWKGNRPLGQEDRDRAAQTTQNAMEGYAKLMTQFRRSGVSAESAAHFTTTLMGRMQEAMAQAQTEGRDFTHEDAHAIADSMTHPLLTDKIRETMKGFVDSLELPTKKESEAEPRNFDPRSRMPVPASQGPGALVPPGGVAPRSESPPTAPRISEQGQPDPAKEIMNDVFGDKASHSHEIGSTADVAGWSVQAKSAGPNRIEINFAAPQEHLERAKAEHEAARVKAAKDATDSAIKEGKSPQEAEDIGFKVYEGNPFNEAEFIRKATSLAPGKIRELLVALRRVAQKAADKGVEITYSSDKARHDAYSRVLEKLGYELASTETSKTTAGLPSKQSTYVWKPRKTAPSETPPPAPTGKPTAKPTVEATSQRLRDLSAHLLDNPTGEAASPPRVYATLNELRATHTDAELQEIAKSLTGKSTRSGMQALRAIWTELTALRRGLEGQETNWTAEQHRTFGLSKWEPEKISTQQASSASRKTENKATKHTERETRYLDEEVRPNLHPDAEAEIDKLDLTHKEKFALKAMLAGRSPAEAGKAVGAKRTTIWERANKAFRVLREAHPEEVQHKTLAEHLEAMRGPEAARMNERGRVRQKGTNRTTAAGLFFGGPTQTAPSGQGGEPAPTPAQIIATDRVQHGVPNYNTSTEPMPNARAMYVIHPEGIVTTKAAAQNVGTAFHEVFHHLTKTTGLLGELEPAKLPADVVRGLNELDYARDANGNNPRANTHLAMIEGGAEWYRKRQTGQLDNLTPDQKAAADYLEAWAKKQGLTEKFDRTRDMWRQHAAQTPTQQAAAHINPTGEKQGPVRTPAEQARTIWQKFKNWADDNIFNSLAVLKRAGMQKAYTLWSRLLYAENHLANRWGKDGIGTLRDGHYTIIGPSKAQITASLQEGDRAPMAPREGGWWGKLKGFFAEPKKVTKAGLFAVTRHILDEVRLGKAEESNSEIRVRTARAALKQAQDKLNNIPASVVGKQARDTWRKLARADIKKAKDEIAAGEKGIRSGQIRQRIVPKDQLDLYRSAMDEFNQDPEFVKRAAAFADKLTEGFNAGLDALAAKDVHRLDRDSVDYLKEKRPTYIPTTRVREDADWSASPGGRRGESMAGVIHERSGSGEQIVDPLLNYDLRLRQVAGQWAEQMRRNAVAAYLRQEGMAEWAMQNPVLKPNEKPSNPYAEHEPWSRESGVATWYWYNEKGNLQSFRVKDRALYELLTGTQGDSNAVAQIFKWMGKIGFDTPWGRVEPLRQSAAGIRQLATGASLAFNVRNALSPFRDPYEFAKNTIDQSSITRLPEMLKRAYAFEVAIWRGEVPKDVVFELFARERGREQRQFGFETPGIVTIPTKSGLLKTMLTKVFSRQTLNVAGAGELAPRFLEFTNRLKQLGWTEERLTAEINKAKQVQAQGGRYRDPLPWEILQDAMEAANEVTVPFNQQGIVTRQINAVVPFFGPAVSGLSKAVRNWRVNAKGASFALGAYLTARLAQWLAFSDDQWYDELTPYDRYNNFVVKIPGMDKPVRIPGARDLEVPVGGLLLAGLDAVAGKDRAGKQLIQQSLDAMAPPTPLPPALNVTQEVLRNRDWTGRPIVPRRDEEAPTGYNLQRHIAPYAIQQLTGGRGELSARGLGVVPFTEVRNAHRSVDELFDRAEELNGEAIVARRQGRVFKNAAELRLVEHAKQQIVNLSHLIRGERKVGSMWLPGAEPPTEQKEKLREQQIEIARKFMAAVHSRNSE